MFKSTLKTGLSLAVAAIVAGGWLFQAQAAGADSQAMVQQNQTCTGVVVDEAGVPVIGAAVLIKGTLKGTSTDVDGHLSKEPSRERPQMSMDISRFPKPRLAMSLKCPLSVIFRPRSHGTAVH